ncbi:hypothetical protein DEU56DRAFT_911640 [Suillus clintonianus]|uniref:uncharacterized protein n=1 Tax=Suillus clintonianus TaxID=1904413 RepID=UPI001B86067F|nr:uncharacterized protein DEU56DRAFT_911640 [Suillus clintonianus]KAG2140570.1 hypothetical protein DEU56DRAFT_911640 [Suillus clintonianus]
MPRRDSDSEDFEAELDAEGSSDDDLETLRTILSVPQPDAPMHEVHKALETTQQAYNTLRVDFRSLKKDYLTLSASVPARSRNRTLKKTSELDTKITAEGKKYTLFHHFWLIPGVFPTTPQPNVDPHSPTRWASPEARLSGTMAELYQCMPKDLHKSMERYTAFDSLFHAAVSAERSNIIHAIKSCAGIIFSALELDPTLFVSQTDVRKRDNKTLLCLLKKNGEGEYIRLAPVLFVRPDAMTADVFLKNPVLVKIVCVEIYGKKVLSGKIKGQKARGQRFNVQCVTEGLIVGAAVMAHFLLTHDPEFTATGAETKINYQADYNFHLERLFKRTPWARSVMDYFNREVFDVTQQSRVQASDDSPFISQPRTWEDDLLDELDAPTQTLTLTSLPSASSIAVDVTSSYHSSMSVHQGQSVSATGQLQLGVSQLSLEKVPPASTTHSASSRQLRVPVTEPPFVPEPEETTRVTRHGGTRAVAPSRAGRGRGKGKGKQL